MESRKQLILIERMDHGYEDNPMKPRPSCNTCKELFQTTTDLEKHRVLNCQKKVVSSGNWSHFDNWEKKNDKQDIIYESYIGPDMNSKEYFDRMLDSTSESSENSICSDTAYQFENMVDEAVPVDSKPDEMTRIKGLVELNTTTKHGHYGKEPPEWYHMPDVSTPKLSDQNIPEEPPKLDTVVACVKCHKIFPNNHLLKRHVHFHNQQKKYQCDNCNLVFKFKHNLIKHKHKKCIHRYKTIKPTKKIKVLHQKTTALNAGKQNAKPDTMERSTQMTPTEITGEINPTETETPTLAKRQKIHTCEICHKYKTAYTTHLKRHQESVHYKVRSACKYCPKTFSDWSNLRTHMVKKHASQQS